MRDEANFMNVLNVNHNIQNSLENEFEEITMQVQHLVCNVNSFSTFLYHLFGGKSKHEMARRISLAICLPV